MQADARHPLPPLLRLLAWGNVFAVAAFLVEVWLVHWQGEPGARAALQGGHWAALGYAAALGATLAMLARARPLRDDAATITAVVAYIARAAFFMVLFVGVADAVISFLRVEELLPALVGDDMARNLGQAAWRGPNVHMPLLVLALAVAAVTRGLGFIWLALLVVALQLLIVLGRFVFFYEQPFLADLVRMWYAGLFLFASAHTLLEDGHVRVDIFYAGMSRRGKALVNGLGALGLGMVMMWTILILGSATSASTIVGPFLRFEQGQQTYGMMTKYLMAVFLGIFAVSMLLQFAAMLLRAGADWLGAPDGATDSDTASTATG